MNLTLEKLCQVIGFDYIEGGNTITTDIRYVVAYSPELLPQNDTVVVVGTYEDLINAPKNLFTNFLCTTPISNISYKSVAPSSSYSANYSVIAFNDLGPEIFTQGDFHIGFAKNDVSVVETLVAVRRELDWQIDFYRYSHVLYDTLGHNTSPQGIIDVATKIFNNPIVVADNSFHVIAHSKMTIENDALWQFICENGTYPKDYLDRLVQYNHYPTIYEKDEINFLTDGDDSNRYYSRKITVNKKDIGFISIIEIFQKMDKHFADLLQVLCSVLSITIKQSELNTERYEHKYMYVLNELLDSRMNTSQIKERLEYASFTPKEYLNVLVFYHNDNSKTISSEYLLEIFERQITGGRGTIRPNGSLAILSMRDSILHPILKDEEELSNLLLKYNMHVGISYTLHNIQDIMVYAIQARESILIGKKFKHDIITRIFSYENYCFFHLLDRVNINEYLIHYCNPKILEIRNYDLVHNTDYLATLRTFLINYMSVGETAKAMHVHRNTIDYRVGKLKDLFNVDVSARSKAFSYQFSLLILDYLEGLV